MFLRLPSAFSPRRPAPRSRGCISRVGAAEVKRAVCARFGILARHWSACRAASQAAALSWREGGAERLRMLEQRIGALDDRWLKDSLDSGKKRRNAVARRKAEVAAARLRKELAGAPRWCFGGRRLLRRGRLREWRRRRDSQAIFCGEAGKRAGNEVAQWSRDGVLRLRLPGACPLPYVVLRDVRFPAVRQSFLESAVAARSPVTWRVKLLRRGKVQLCVTFDEPEPELASDSAAGVVGVDPNRDHLAVVDSRRGRSRRRRGAPCAADRVRGDVPLAVGFRG